MMKSKQQEENLIYVYSGYIGFGEHRYDDIPQYNAQYPNSVSTSSIPVKAGDKSVVTYTYSPQRRSRLYNVEGNYYDVIYDYNVTVPRDGYIRFVAHMGFGSFNSIKIVKSDGTEIDYKIIDRR